MTEQQTELMTLYGITEEQKSVFIYKNYQYGRLEDALNYAKLEARRAMLAAPKP